MGWGEESGGGGGGGCVWVVSEWWLVGVWRECVFV